MKSRYQIKALIFIKVQEHIYVYCELFQFYHDLHVLFGTFNIVLLRIVWEAKHEIGTEQKRLKVN